MKMKTRIVALLLSLLCIVSVLTSCSFGITPTNGKDPDEEDTGTVTSTIAVSMNEVCSKNTMYAAPDGAYYDWIEIYNSSNQPYSLANYGISDKKSNIKHVFGDDIVVPAKGFLLLWACGSELMGGKPTGGIYLPFAISGIGEDLYFFSTRGSVLDHLSVPALEDDITFGYTEEQNGVLARLSPTPGTTNSNARVQSLDDSVISFSHESGFYNTAFTLKLTLPEGYTAYYTTDCTEPNRYSEAFPKNGLAVSDLSSKANQYSNLYTGNIDQAYTGYTKAQIGGMAAVDKCAVVRVIAYDETMKIRTDVITKSYFIGYNMKNGYDNVSVVSLVTTPDALYGDEGLFTNSSNWTKKSDAEERAAELRTNFSYFGTDKTYSFDQDIGIRLHGTSTRSHAQKSLTLFARKQYGNGAFEDTIVGTADECHSMVLRTDGVSKIQEGFLQSLVSDRELSTCDYIPTVVFIDGEYAGVYNLYERFSDDYVEQYYGVDKDNVYIVKKGTEGNVDGALTAYQTFYAALTTNNLANEATYARLCEMVDMQSLIDLLATQAYLCNSDFSFIQNIACWRTIDPTLEDPNNIYADGKWRFVLYDLDISIGAWAPATNFSGLSFAANQFSCGVDYNGFTEGMIWAGAAIAEMPAVKNLLKSESFRRSFAQTFQDLVNVNFDSATVLEKLNATLDIYEPLMEKHFARYGVPIKSYKLGSTEGWNNDAWKIDQYFGGTTTLSRVYGATWRREMQFAVKFFTGHAAYALEDMKEFLSMSGEQYEIQLTVTDPAMGTIVLSSGVVIAPDANGEWNGTYYNDYEVALTAVANTGYHFVGWTLDNGTIQDESLVLSERTGIVTITAQFAAD